MGDPKDKPKWIYRLTGGALYRFVWLVQRTSRWVPHLGDIEGRRQGRKLTAQHPFIFAMWHGQFLLLPLLTFPKYPTKVMVARHGDAEVASEMLQHFGIDLIRGAGAGGRKKDRGGSHAIRASQEALRTGISVAMTADVPPGPARRAGLGIVTLARITGRPIMPVAIASSRLISFPTWSRLTINLPWSTCGSAVGDPIFVPHDASDAEQERLRQLVEDSLNAVTREAYTKAGTADPLLAAKQRAAAQASPMLAGYRIATRALQPIVPAVLAYRARKGKEDPARAPERLGIASRPRPEGKLIWLHAASVGETNAVMRLIGELKTLHPVASVLLTTGTKTSAALATARLGDQIIHQYIPVDGPSYVDKFLDHWRPHLGVFVESEIWPNLVLAAATRKIPLALVNARLSDRSLVGWRRRPAMARRLFGSFAVVLAQTEYLSRQFGKLGAPNARPAGNLKYDSAPLPVDAVAAAAFASAVGDRPLFLAASTHPGEDAVIGDALRLLLRERPNLLAVIVPRHPERGAAIVNELRAAGFIVAQRSTGALPAAGDSIYVADTLGELGLFYAKTPVAFIGGSLVEHGGQNPIEAIQLGAAVISGAHWRNFSEVYGALHLKDGCRKIAAPAELAPAIASLLADPAAADRMRRNARNVVDNFGGALAKTLAALAPLLQDGTTTRAP